MRFVDDVKNYSRDSNSTGLDVIAAGLWRCSTSSLQAAFENEFGYEPSMHGAYIMPHINLQKLCCRAILEKDVEKRRAMLRELMTGFNASSDFPGMVFVDDLLDMYPSAKIVLNTRSSANDWVRSVRGSLQFFASTRYLLATCLVPQSYWHHRIYQNYATLAKRRYGVDDVFSAELYEKHNRWVRKVAAERGREVLEWDASQGWEPLCNFLQKPVPDTPFPRLNETSALLELRRYLVLRGLLAWLAAIASPLLVIFAIWYARST